MSAHEIQQDTKTGRQAAGQIKAADPELFVSLVAGASCTPDEYGHCVTCSDEAQQVRVLSVDTSTELALAEVNGVTGEVDISLVDDLVPGDLILIHGGVAIAKL